MWYNTLIYSRRYHYFLFSLGHNSSVRDQKKNEATCFLLMLYLAWEEDEVGKVIMTYNRFTIIALTVTVPWCLYGKLVREGSVKCFALSAIYLQAFSLLRHLLTDCFLWLQWGVHVFVFFSLLLLTPSQARKIPCFHPPLFPPLENIGLITWFRICVFTKVISNVFTLEILMNMLHLHG